MSYENRQTQQLERSRRTFLIQFAVWGSPCAIWSVKAGESQSQFYFRRPNFIKGVGSKLVQYEFKMFIVLKRKSHLTDRVIFMAHK